jgi:nitrate reductase (cytochrome), electron transfer subunit
MRESMKTKLVAIAAAAGLLLVGAHGVIQAEGLKSLRGDLAIDASDVAPESVRLQRFDDLIPRNFEEQPPLSPHDVEGPRYTINISENRCLSCHDRPYYEEEEAPMIGDSHYILDEAGHVTQISMKRYFCNQCHVSQTDANPLVVNTFTPLVPR